MSESAENAATPDEKPDVIPNGDSGGTPGESLGEDKLAPESSGAKPAAYSLVDMFRGGIFTENPVLVLLLGLCPTLAVTTSLTNAIGMGLAATFVLICSNVVISLFSRFFPSEVRIPCFIVVIASFVTLVKMIMAAFFPDLKEALGIFLPLIVVNCIILGRAEAFASKRSLVPSFWDGVSMGVGFTLALCLIGGIREVMGEWKLLGIPLSTGGMEHSAKVMIIAPGGFLTLGVVLGAIGYLRARKAECAKKTEPEDKTAPEDKAGPDGKPEGAAPEPAQ